MNPMFPAGCKKNEESQGFRKLELPENQANCFNYLPQFLTETREAYQPSNQYAPRAPGPPDSKFEHTDPLFNNSCQQSLQQRDYSILQHKLSTPTKRYCSTKTSYQPHGDWDKKGIQHHYQSSTQACYSPPVLRDISETRTYQSPKKISTSLYISNENYIPRRRLESEKKASYKLLRAPAAEPCFWLKDSRCPYPQSKIWNVPEISEAKQRYSGKQPKVKTFHTKRKIEDTDIFARAELPVQCSVNQFSYDKKELPCPPASCEGRSIAASHSTFKLGDERFPKSKKPTSHIHYPPYPTFDVSKQQSSKNYDDVLQPTGDFIDEPSSCYKTDYKFVGQKIKHVDATATWQSNVSSEDYPTTRESSYKADFQPYYKPKPAKPVMPVHFIESRSIAPFDGETEIRANYTFKEKPCHEINPTALKELKNSHLDWFKGQPISNQTSYNEHYVQHLDFFNPVPEKQKLPVFADNHPCTVPC